MAATAFSCPACKAELNVAPGTQEVIGPCPSCQAPIQAYFLPAFFRPIDLGSLATPLADHTESSCFFHPQKQAVRVCDGCGRMICALCDVDLGSGHLCPNCIASGRKKKTLTAIEDRRTRYDSIVMLLGVLSIFIYPMSVLLAPAALYMSVRYWNAPGSLVGSSRTRFVIGSLLAVGMCVMMILIFTLAATHPARHR